MKSVQGHGLSGDILVKVSLTSPVVREEQLAAAAATVTAGSTAPTGSSLRLFSLFLGVKISSGVSNVAGFIYLS